MFADRLIGVVEEGDENGNHGDGVLGMLGTNLLHHPEPHKKTVPKFERMEGMCVTFDGWGKIESVNIAQVKLPALGLIV